MWNVISLYSFVFCCFDKMPWSKPTLWKKSLFQLTSRWMRVFHDEEAWQEVEGIMARAESWNSTWSRGGTESVMRLKAHPGWDTSASKTASPHSLSKQHCQIGTESVHSCVYRRHFSFKQPQSPYPQIIQNQLLLPHVWLIFLFFSFCLFLGEGSGILCIENKSDITTHLTNRVRGSLLRDEWD